MANRGVIYVYWGDKVEDELKRSILSLRRYHPELPVETFKLDDDSSLLDKASMFEMSPFDTTLFLDTDTVVLDRLDFGFEKAEQHKLAISICESPWARRYGGITGDHVEYNTGVIFFTKSVKEVFDQWEYNNRRIDSSIRWMKGGQVAHMACNDQGGFAQAIIDTGFNPYVLPYNWNFRPIWHRSFFGPIKIWHDHNEVPMALETWNEEQTHEASLINFKVVGR